MKPQLDRVTAFDQELVDEQLTPTPEIDRRVFAAVDRRTAGHPREESKRSRQPQDRRRSHGDLPLSAKSHDSCLRSGFCSTQRVKLPIPD